jgi:hypothetical protein
VLVSAHALRFAGASPKYSATCACTSGFVIQFSHSYEQFGCLVLLYTIQLSDQAVEPSFGMIAFTGGDVVSACTPFVITCQVVPSTKLAFVKASCSFR